MNKPDPLLVRRLEIGSVNASKHSTMAKARRYYIHIISPQRRAILDTVIRGAFSTDDWKPLSKYMEGWW